MALSITAAEVYARLRNLTSSDFYDSADLATYFIPNAHAYCNNILAKNSKDYDNLESYEQQIVKNIAILYVCAEVIESALLSDYGEFGISETAVKGSDKTNLGSHLMKKIKTLWAQISCSTIRVTGGVTGGDDYVSDRENIKNIDFTNAEKPFSRWP
jgi:hypothetical protein